MSVRPSRRRSGPICFLAACLCFFLFPALAVTPYPISANQRAYVACFERPAIGYDIYLPPGYSTNGPPLPIIYTMHPNGGGMVGYFQAVCSNMNIIVVGLTNSRNGTSWEIELKEFYAVSRDIRLRLLYDPTAVFLGGFSGGGECCYVFSRFYAQHVAGLMPMAGWLGRTSTYYSTDRVQSNLLIARITGDSDTGALYYLAPDSNYVASCGAVVRDWYFQGGHSIGSPDDLKTSAFNWLLSQRVPPGPDDQSYALAQAVSWRSRINLGQREAVVRECVAAIMEHPRSWIALEGQLVLDDAMLLYTSFRPLRLDNMAQGDFAYDLFFYFARGAVMNSDLGRFRSAMKALTGVTGSSGDRAGDIRDLILTYKYSVPAFEFAAPPNKLDFWVVKDTPGLSYYLQTRSNLVNDVWQD